jgi:hypothetical protein
MFGCARDLDGEAQRNDDQGLAPIGAHDQEIVTSEPVIESAESIAAAFDFDAAIDAEQGYAQIPRESSAGRTTQRDPLGGKTIVLLPAPVRGAVRWASAPPTP